MPKLIFCVLMTLSFLYAKTQNIELLAQSITKQNNLIVASGDILVYSQEYLITAKKAIYNQENGDLELFENVNFMKDINDAVKSNYAKINLYEKQGKFTPFFTYEQKSKVWLECQKASSDKRYYKIKNSITSSCNVQNPDWSFAFKSGKYNKKTKFLHLKNVTFYIKDTPILYLPYFGISTNKTRTTGLLNPIVGYGRNDGFIFMQPFYIAKQDWWDLQITPQIRAKRGVGIYNTFRFVDTPYSKGSISAGIFKSKKSYKQTEKLQNRVHKGLEIHYKNTKILEDFLSKEVDDGLLFNATLLNDIDYLNLKKDNNAEYESLVTSKLNYYINSDKHFGGIYAKYHIDTKKVSNTTTLQELPAVQYHHYLDAILMPNMLYSFDMKYHNFTRQKGVGAEQLKANLPITFYTNFFHKFLNFSISENIYLTGIKYRHNKKTSDFYAKNFHKISFFSDISKPYSNFYHIMQFKLDYILPSFKQGQIREDFLKTNDDKEMLGLKFDQYFYNLNGEKKIKHGFQQVFNLEKNEYNYEDLEHDFAYYFDQDNYVENDLYYSYKNKKISKIQTSAHLKNDKMKLDFIHTYKNDTNSIKHNMILAKFKLKYNNFLSYFGSINYDLNKDYSNSWQIGMKLAKKCWSYTLAYKEETDPKLTSIGSGGIDKKTFYVGFKLFPIGGAEYRFLR